MVNKRVNLSILLCVLLGSKVIYIKLRISSIVFTGHMKIDEPKTPYNYAEHEDPLDHHAGPSANPAGALDHKCLLQK